MGRKVRFIVDITFSDPVNKESQLRQVSANIKKALVRQVEDWGLAPEASGVVTDKIAVYPEGAVWKDKWEILR